MKNSISINPLSTIAILIGTTKYVDFPDIPNIKNNINDFELVLKDKDVFSLPQDNIHTYLDENSADIKKSLMSKLFTSNKKEIDTLLIYFAGHGYRRSDGHFHLCTKDTEKSLINLDGASSIPYDSLKKIIFNSGIYKVVIFIDACYSGSITMSDDIDESLSLRGSYIITSSSSTEVSFFKKEDRYTIFTGALLETIQTGVDSREREVSLSALFNQICQNIRQKNVKMTPQQLSSKEITSDTFYLFKNVRFLQKEVHSNIILSTSESAIKNKNVKNEIKSDEAKLIFKRGNFDSILGDSDLYIEICWGPDVYDYSNLKIKNGEIVETWVPIRESDYSIQVSSIERTYRSKIDKNSASINNINIQPGVYYFSCGFGSFGTKLKFIKLDKFVSLNEFLINPQN
jgi:hypothetical protein